MIAIEKIPSAKFNSGKTYQITPQGAAFGNIGKWLMFLDAAEISGANPINRAVKGEVFESRSGYSVDLTTLNGHPAFAVGSREGEPNSGTQLSAPQNVPTGDWTLIFTIALAQGRGTSSTYLRRNVIRASVDGSNVPEGLGMNVCFLGIGSNAGLSKIVLTDNAGNNTTPPERIAYSVPGTMRDKTAVFAITFSTSRGLKIFMNGQQVAENPSDVTPLTAGIPLYFFSALEAGKVPELLLNAEDLSAIPGAIQTISDFYVEKYGIV